MRNLEKNPWTIIDEKKIYNNPWIELTEFDVLNPSGGKGIYSVVHFHNYAIGILPLDENNNTWLVGQYRFPLKQYSWEIPEGGGTKELPPLESAKRELLEETGIEATEWIPIIETHLSNSAMDEFGIIYIAKGLSFTNSSPEETEELQVKKLPFDEVYNMVMNGEITDGLTMLAVMKTKLLMLEGKI
ncbi:DNA mismatch repair protein MutT [Bacteroidota bacterium]|nr:DNA mismatch repair protein MutT [Bacteroidota bacterium]